MSEDGQEEYPFLEENYRVWLEAFEPDDFIGIREHSQECTLARYLRTRFNKTFQVLWSDTTRWAWYRAVGEKKRISLPEWANQEARTFDVIPSKRPDITKEEYDAFVKMGR